MKTSRSTSVLRIGGLDTMFVVSGISAAALVALAQGLEPAAPEAMFYDLFNTLRKMRVSPLRIVEDLPRDADFLVRIDPDKILVRETTEAYPLLPSWKKNVAPLRAIYPTVPGAEASWVSGDPSLEAIRALESFVISTPALGKDYSDILLETAKIARRGR